MEEVDGTYCFSRCCSSFLSSKVTQQLQIASLSSPFFLNKNGFLLEENLKLHGKNTMWQSATHLNFGGLGAISEPQLPLM